MKLLKVLIFGNGSRRVPTFIKIHNDLKMKGWKKLSYLILIILERAYGLYLNPNTYISESVKFPHPTSIVIGAGVEIGENVTIYQNVTIGGARIGDAKKNNYPIIGNNTIIFSGAVLIGEITIGENVIIGANSVVNVDVPDSHLAVGVPCRLKKLEQ